jgi:radical SAM superfamily enzyme YgiQ (UPF0313 family)
MKTPPPDGWPVVLTADRTLMARYDTLFDGMVAGSQTTRVPGPIMRGVLCPRVPDDGGRARRAPLGLRRVEAALVEGGWSAEDVAVVPPERLKDAIGPRTRILGLICGDPLGHGMNSTTIASIVGGRIWPSQAFLSLAKRIARLRRALPALRLVVGGPGVWQLVADDDARRRLGVDHVISGYCEGNVADVFRQIATDENVATLCEGRPVDAASVPAVRAPTNMGCVEISRGCGWGCSFCTLGVNPMMHLPVATIMQDVDTNLAGGLSTVTLATEDVFRFGAQGSDVQPQALIDLLTEMRSRPGVTMIQPDHANITSAAGYSDAELLEVRRLFAGGEDPRDFVWVNLGVETACGDLLHANGGGPKMRLWDVDEWGDRCREQVLRLCRAGFFPLVSLVLGLPGETPQHLARTQAWVDDLRKERLAIFPLLHAPIGDGDEFGRRHMTRAHWRLLRSCYKMNFRWTPRLVWNNQARAGVSLQRRLLLQLLGQGQVLWWKALFAWRSRRSAP